MSGVMTPKKNASVSVEKITRPSNGYDVEVEIATSKGLKPNITVSTSASNLASAPEQARIKLEKFAKDIAAACPD